MIDYYVCYSVCLQSVVLRRKRCIGENLKPIRSLLLRLQMTLPAYDGNSHVQDILASLLYSLWYFPKYQTIPVSADGQQWKLKKAGQEAQRRPQKGKKDLYSVCCSLERTLPWAAFTCSLTYLISIVNREHFVIVYVLRVCVYKQNVEWQNPVCKTCTIEYFFNVIRIRSCPQPDFLTVSQRSDLFCCLYSASPSGWAATFHDVMWLSACCLHPLSAV